LVAIGVVFPAAGALGIPAMRRGEKEAAAAVQPFGELADLLARLDMFTEAPRSVLERLAMAAEPRDVPDGTVLIREGEPSDALWVLVAGSLAIDQAAAGELPPVTAPGYVGEIGLMHRRPRTATVRAQGDCALFRIDGSEFISAYESTPPSTSLVQLAGVRLMRTNPGLSEPAPTGPSAP
jgi:NTE family protein